MKPSLKLGTFKSEYIHTDKFRFFSCTDIFSQESYSVLQEGFDQLAWKKKDSHFYSQYSSKISAKDRTPFAWLYQKNFFIPFKTKIEQILQTELRNHLSLIAHKLISSQEIGIHNDYCDPELGYENYRFIFQFSRPNQLIDGGKITFLFSENKENIIKIYPHRPNVGICFEITPYSYHFVEPVQGERHTLVMYLWDAARKYDGSGTEVY